MNATMLTMAKSPGRPEGETVRIDHEVRSLLHSAMLRKGYGVFEVASEARLDPKTVRRMITPAKKADESKGFAKPNVLAVAHAVGVDPNSLEPHMHPVVMRQTQLPEDEKRVLAAYRRYKALLPHRAAELVEELESKARSAAQSDPKLRK